MTTLSRLQKEKDVSGSSISAPIFNDRACWPSETVRVPGSERWELTVPEKSSYHTARHFINSWKKPIWLLARADSFSLSCPCETSQPAGRERDCDPPQRSTPRLWWWRIFSFLVDDNKTNARFESVLPLIEQYSNQTKKNGIVMTGIDLVAVRITSSCRGNEALVKVTRTAGADSWLSQRLAQWQQPQSDENQFLLRLTDHLDRL